MIASCSSNNSNDHLERCGVITAEATSYVYDPHRDRTEQLLFPVVLVFLDFSSLMTIVTLNKRFHALLKDENSALGFWPAVCNAFCAHAGLYSPVIANPENIIPRFQYRKHFFDDLWTLRNKWTNKAGEGESLSYKVRVSCRFRPGESPGGRVCLPLHQFLRLRRQKKAKQEQENQENHGTNGANDIFVGERDPEEFCDPLLGSLMRDPVLLTSSGRIVDRTVAMQCIQRGGRDPFNGKRLTTQMLAPQPELASRIQAWRDRPERTDISVDIKDAKNLVEDTAVNQDFLEALLEVERMQNMMRKANRHEYLRRLGAPIDGGEDDPNMVDPAAAAGEGDVAGQNNQEINPDITVGLLDDVDPATNDADNNPFSIQHLMQHGAQHNPLLTLHQQQQQQQEKKNEVARVVEVNDKASFVSMHVPGTGVRPFHFSNVYTPTITQEIVYEKTARDSVEAALNGCNACVLCYGQTGSGKTYSFVGPEGTVEREDTHQERQLRELQKEKKAGEYNEPSIELLDEETTLAMRTQTSVLPQSGMLLRSASDFFRAKAYLARRAGITIGVKLQFVEVYEEKVTDLMTGRVVTVRRDTGHVANGSEHPCETLYDFLQLYKIAHGRQRFAETAMNERSSRAHTLVIFHITQQRAVNGLTAAVPAVDTEAQATAAPQELLVHSQLYLVDLAGSERVKKSKVTGQRMREAVGINSSLLVLGKVISALVEGESHVPYLESRLTTLLKAAFGGNARTMVLINTRTEEDHGDETLQSLRFGERCGMISNSLKQTASSFESTIAVMDEALHQLQGQLAHLQARNKQHLDSYKTLQVNYDALVRKKHELLALNASSTSSSASVKATAKKTAAIAASNPSAAVDAGPVNL